MSNTIVFVINLLQDINILRPLIYLSTNALNLKTEIILTHRFFYLDNKGLWLKEIRQIQSETHALEFIINQPIEIKNQLKNKQGIIFSASESNVGPHKNTHDVFRFTPSSFIRITIQHGYECVGFLHNEKHNECHGRHVQFAADIVCGWLPKENMLALQHTELDKYIQTGPTSVLQNTFSKKTNPQNQMGLVCENLHSVRLGQSNKIKVKFIDVFTNFAKSLQKENDLVCLRPHPAGQYMLKENISLPTNVVLNNKPMYKIDLSQFAYGISAPSSVLIDMILANIPVAVWQDAQRKLDVNNYEGLTSISSLSDWLNFSQIAVSNPKHYLIKQQRFMAKIGLLCCREKVYQRFASLMMIGHSDIKPSSESIKSFRIALITQNIDATLKLYFLKTLAPLIESKKFSICIICDKEITQAPNRPQPFLVEKLSLFSPNLIIFNRYGGEYGFFINAWAKQNKIPTLFHIDDDLLNCPEYLGFDKYIRHHHYKRQKTLFTLLNSVNLITTSTENLKNHLQKHDFFPEIKASYILPAAIILNKPIIKPVTTIGYMGTNHQHDFKLIENPLANFLAKNPSIRFEMFGKTPIPKALIPFKGQIRQLPWCDDYDDFIKTLSECAWDIGLCPLDKTSFNDCKSYVKWLEYSACGTAVIASAHTVYDETIGNSRGILANTSEDWFHALNQLTTRPQLRFDLVSHAQKHLLAKHHPNKLLENMIFIFNSITKHHQSSIELAVDQA